MDFLKASMPKADPEQIRQLKAWVHEALEMSADVPVSISQLACHEPNCPPVETVISIMTRPPSNISSISPSLRLSNLIFKRYFNKYEDLIDYEYQIRKQSPITTLN